MYIANLCRFHKMFTYLPADWSIQKNPHLLIGDKTNKQLILTSRILFDLTNFSLIREACLSLLS